MTRDSGRVIRRRCGSNRPPLPGSRIQRLPGSPAPGIAQVRGFTLLEILLALVLMAFVMLGVWGALSGATRITHSADALMAQSESVATTQRFLRTWLAATEPQPYLAPGAQRARMFRGDATSLQYVAPLPAQSGHAGLYLQTLELVKGQAGHYTLKLEYLPYSGDKAPAGKPSSHVLLKDLDGGKFQYLAIAAYGEPAAWRDDWRAANGLPLAVRVQLDPARSMRVPFPPMVVRLHMGEGYGVQTGGAP